MGIAGRLAAFVAFVLIGLTVLSAAHAQAEKRLALIIANDSYTSKALGELPGVKVDIELMEPALKKAGFDVTVARNLKDRQEFEASLSVFSERLLQSGPNAVAFVYYTGHGVSDAKRGRNYLIPTSANLASLADLPLKGVALDDVLDAIQATDVKIAMVVADACRNTPVSLTRGTKGMVAVSNRTDMLVAFSTATGETAEDNSLYARTLAAQINEPGSTTLTAFALAQTSVAQATGRLQRPEFVSGLVEHITFVPGSKTGVAEAPQPTLSAAERELIDNADKQAALGDDAALRARNAEARAKQAAMSPTACRTSVYAGECPEPGQIVYGQYVWTQASASDGESYAGQLRDDVRLLGVFSYPVTKNTIARYEGEWRPEPSNKAGERSGFGVVVYHNGDRLRGSFVNGAAHGLAVLERADRSRVAGRWDMGVPAEAVAWDSEGRRTTPRR